MPSLMETGAAMQTHITLAELMGAFSHALDLTEGQPEGHGVRCCWIGMRVGQTLGLDESELWSLYYTLLLKDIGCSSNAARICELYLADDRAFKRDFKTIGTGLPATLAFVLSQTGRHAGWRQRVAAIANILRNGDAIAQELIQTRCDRGARIVERLRFPASVADGIRGLDEHFDGSGRPDHLEGSDIPIASRIALLAQVVDIFHAAGGPPAARVEVAARAGSWLDPTVVAAFNVAQHDPVFWWMLGSDALAGMVQSLEPGEHAVEVDEDYLDDIAEAFGEVVDTKSSFTAGHSTRVAALTDAVADVLGMDAPRRRWLRRGALLHDVGKLGVSNTILDKPARLDADEWVAVQRHAGFTREILGRIGPFRELAPVAAAHHEKLDGTGYPLGLAGDAIALETRIITVADIYDAISAPRPYHAARSVGVTLDIMRSHIGTAIDPRCFAALEQVVTQAAVAPEADALPA